MSYSRNMFMRHPLTDLPLDQFAPLEHRTSTKRPLSPNATIFSPSKRRILSAEGLYSPEKKRNTTPANQLFLEPLGSPRSPARRLDFTALNCPSPRKARHRYGRDASPRPETPASRTGGSPKLAPSPEIASGSSSDASTIFHGRSSRDTIIDTSYSCAASEIMVPREMPAFADRQSIHWPGFDVYQDTHISIPTSDSIMHALEHLDSSDRDDAKENLRPRKRAGKRVALDEGQSIRSIMTEGQARETEGPVIMPMLTPSPGNRTMTPREKQQERRQKRFIMVSEMDEEEDVDNQL